MKKKTISIILILTIILTFLLQYNYSSIAVENEVANFTVNSIIAVEGDEITISIDMTNNCEFVAANLEFQYDSSKMEYVESTKGAVLNSGAMGIINNNTANSKVRIAYTGNPSVTDKVVRAGNVCTIKFNIIDGKGTEATSILSVPTLKKSDGTNVNSNITQGKIQIVDIELNKTSTSIDRGENETISVVALPAGVNISDKVVVWSSLNTNIATINSNGVITAKNIGDTKVSATVMGITATCDVNVYASLKSISLNKEETIIHKNNNETLTVTYNPTDTTDSKLVEWTSSKTSVATVDANGIITALNAGTTTITATVGTKKAVCEVTVDIPLQSISLNKSTMTINKEEKETLDIIYNPTDTTDSKAAVWESSNQNVVTVNNDGEITAVGAGTATVTANVNGKEATCEVTVYAPLKSISLGRTTLKLPKKQKTVIGITYNPTDTTDDKTAIWSSLDETIATVNSNGQVIALNDGTTTITANVGGKQAYYELTVEGIVGDIDGDNARTAYDSYKALEESNAPIKKETTKFALDVDGDDEITSFDAYKILECSIGIIDEKYWN